jgi:hypothetical protein
MCVHLTAVVNLVSRHARRQCVPSFCTNAVCHGGTIDLRLNGKRTSPPTELCRSQQLVISNNDVR